MTLKITLCSNLILLFSFCFDNYVVSGTMSVHRFFRCGGQRSAHLYAGRGKADKRTGACIYKNIEAGHPPLDMEACGLPPIDVFTDNNNLQSSPKSCYYPSVHSLNDIYMAYPNATLLLGIRDTDAWIGSVLRWHDLMLRLRKCHDLWPMQKKILNTMNDTTIMTIDDIREFYLWHQNHVRTFAKEHPSMTYIEIRVEANNTGSILEEKTGIPKDCWDNHNQNLINPANSSKA